jgi:hypothetical protein
MSFCNICESEPCLFEEHIQYVMSEVESVKEEYTNVHGQPCSNNLCRKACYRQFSTIINGHLGQGNRLRLPQCVEDGVRLQFPNESGREYLGFKAK